LSKKKNQI